MPCSRRHPNLLDVHILPPMPMPVHARRRIDHVDHVPTLPVLREDPQHATNAMGVSVLHEDPQHEYLAQKKGERRKRTDFADAPSQIPTVTSRRLEEDGRKERAGQGRCTGNGKSQGRHRMHREREEPGQDVESDEHTFAEGEEYERWVIQMNSEGHTMHRADSAQEGWRPNSNNSGDGTSGGDGDIGLQRGSSNCARPGLRLVHELPLSCARVVPSRAHAPDSVSADQTRIILFIDSPDCLCPPGLLGGEV
ncbi:hypothetical protein DFH07DRAFT_1030111 [Mycena maculata]|uniref:Uncharacterized protein n=1 Tax=Mycena maculata TaxID=230809 RepID=A0AAD7K6I3_9AGAR|nr:hypothetical protein DFH07DRAFT_1030111 [Mycena maculata]